MTKSLTHMKKNLNQKLDWWAITIHSLYISFNLTTNDDFTFSLQSTLPSCKLGKKKLIKLCQNWKVPCKNLTDGLDML